MLCCFSPSRALQYGDDGAEDISVSSMPKEVSDAPQKAHSRQQLASLDSAKSETIYQLATVAKAGIVSTSRCVMTKFMTCELVHATAGPQGLF